MITFDEKRKTYICPFCNQSQSYFSRLTYGAVDNQIYNESSGVVKGYEEAYFSIYTLSCTNQACHKRSVIAINITSGKQIDIYPQNVYRHFPDYIPQQIRDDYEEASQIIDKSPKAAATLLRRCLQGMIRDFWGVSEKRLIDEINAIKDKVTPSQWKAIDGLRHIGNIGAHMEKDVNLIVDVTSDEATKLLKLIELLLEKWYISRQEEEELYDSIVTIADEKAEERKGSK